MSSRTRAALVLLASTTLAGCLLGPDYQRPALDVPSKFREQTAAENAGRKLDTEWWKLFGDPALTALEEQAREANQDLQLAIARVTEARATARISEADFYPVITMDPSYQRERLSANRPLTSGSSTGSGKAVYDTDIVVPFDLSYEIDLWGRVRRSFESATAVAKATEDDYGVVALTLAADVAANYFAIRSLDAQGATLHESVGNFTESLRLVESRYRAGIVSELDVAQARTQLATTVLQEANVRLLRAQSEHALAVLCGRPASDFSVPPQAVDLEPPAVPAGLPSQLLERRPDVAEAEQNVVAANAGVGVAEALFFPQVQLTGVAGFESTNFGDLFKWDSRIWSLGPSISVPVFEGGRLRANLSGAQAQSAQAVAVYRQTILGAFRDVEDALVGVRLWGEQGDSATEAVDAAARTVFIARSQYYHGITDYLSVIVAESTHLSLELQATQIQQQRLTAAVLLVKAIGGGWQ